MAISSQVSQLSFTGNASTSTPYALANLRFDDDSWITVEEIDEDGVITTLATGTDYTITGSGTASSASIVTGGGAIPATSTLRVSRNTPRVQSGSLSSTGALPSATLERMADREIMALIDEKRRQEAGLARSLRLPDGKTAADITAALAGGKYIHIDEAGELVFHSAATILAASGGAVDGVGLPSGGDEGDLLAKASGDDADAAFGPLPQVSLLKAKTIIANPSRLIRFWMRAQELSASNHEGKYLTALATVDSIGTESGPFPALASIWAQRWGVGALLSTTLCGWDAAGCQFNSSDGSTPTTGTVTAYGIGVAADYTYLPNGRFWRLAASATVTEVPRDSMRRAGWRMVRCFYGKKTGGGTLTFDLKLDGVTVSGGTQAVNTSTGSGTNDFGWVDFEFADGLERTGALSLVVIGSVADADYLGSIVYLESGVIPILFGKGGGTLPSQAVVPAANWSKFATATDPALVLLALKGGVVSDVEDRFALMAAQIPEVSVLALGNFESEAEVSDDGQDTLMREVIRRCAIQYRNAYVDEWDLLGSHQDIIDQGLEDGDPIHFGEDIWRIRGAWLDHHLLALSPVGIAITEPVSPALDRTVSFRDLALFANTWFPRAFQLPEIPTQSLAANYTLAATLGVHKLTWTTSVANPSTSGVIWGNNVRFRGHISFLSQFDLFENLADVDMKVRLGYGYVDYPANPLAGAGFVFNLGYDSLASAGTPWIQFEVHTGSVLHTSPKIYLATHSGGRGYQKASDDAHRWVIQYDGTGDYYTNKRVRAWMMPLAPSAPSSALEAPMLVADWTFTPAVSFWGGGTGYGSLNLAASGAIGTGGEVRLESITHSPIYRPDLLARP